MTSAVAPARASCSSRSRSPRLFGAAFASLPHDPDAVKELAGLPVAILAAGSFLAWTLLIRRWCPARCSPRRPACCSDRPGCRSRWPAPSSVR